MKPTSRLVAVAVAAVLTVAVSALGTPSVSAGPAGEVIILGPTVSGGASSVEAEYVASIGLTPNVVDDAGWAALTAEQFGNARAIIIGDPTCSVNQSNLSAAEANAMTWGPQVDGEIIIIGTDPVFHYGTGQAQQLIEQGIDFAVSDPSATGLYMTTSCWYETGGETIAALAGIDGGNFVTSATDCDDDVHITATHPALAGLTDEGLSDWSCSTHNGFSQWPPTFAPLAMAVIEDGDFVAPDGTRGEVYIIARGVEVFRALNCEPIDAAAAVGSGHTITATFVVDDLPVVGQEITFTVTTGPHAGTTGTATTDDTGRASHTFTGTSPGTDTIIATSVVQGVEFESDVCSVTWSGSTPTSGGGGGGGTAPRATPRFTG